MSGMAVEVTGSPDPFEQPPQEVPTRQGDPDEGQPYSQVLPQCRGFLEGRLAYRIQELTYGGPDRETRRMLDLLADEVEGTLTRKSQIADPRNPVTGTKLIRDWDGVAHTVTVLKDGFDWGGRRYKSLSAIARAITGTQWNGYRFFGLRARKRGEA